MQNNAKHTDVHSSAIKGCFLLLFSQFDGFFMKPIAVTLKGCPPGRALASLTHNVELFQCSCDRNNENILSCEPNGFDVVLKVCVMYVHVHVQGNRWQCHFALWYYSCQWELLLISDIAVYLC